MASCCHLLSLISIPDSGQQLHRDDPSALTDIIKIVQSQVTDESDDLRYTLSCFREIFSIADGLMTQFSYSIHD